MKYTMILALFATFFFTGCGGNQPELEVTEDQSNYEKPTEEKEKLFHTAMSKIAHSTVENPSYNKMSLDTPEKKKWFKDLMYHLWDRQITRKSFVTQGLEKYPKHGYEFSYIANSFQRF